MDTIYRLRTSRIAGVAYLIIFISGIFANFFVLENLIVPGDAARTIGNIAEKMFLFRVGIFGFIIMVIADIALAWLLYVLFKPVNSELSLFSGWLRLINGAIFAIALFNLFAVLRAVNEAEHLNIIEDTLLPAQVMSSLNSFNDLWLIGLIFFGLHLFLLGYLIVKSNTAPKVIGILLIIAAAGYLIDSFAYVLLATYSNYADIFSSIVIVPGVVGELSFTFWLLFKGVR